MVEENGGLIETPEPNNRTGNEVIMKSEIWQSN